MENMHTDVGVLRVKPDKAMLLSNQPACRKYMENSMEIMHTGVRV